MASSFKYYARAKEGELVSGVVEADSEDSVVSQLIQRNLTPISIQAIQTKDSQAKDILKVDILRPGVKLEDLILLCRQMYSLTKAGVSISPALTQLKETTRSPRLRKCLVGVIEDINAGKTLSSGLRKYPKVFSDMFVNVIDAGESAGQLDAAFLQLAEYLELEEKTIKRIKSATRYPLLVIGALFAALLVINFFIIPAFSKLFAQFHGDLPLPTRIIMGFSNFMVDNWLYLLFALFVLVVIFRYYIKTEKGRLAWHWSKLKFPVIGNIVYRIMLSRFSRTFSMVLRTGVPLVNGITLVANSVGNDYIKKRVLEMRDGIESGETLTKAATDSKLFSPLTLQMISVGEQTGEIENLLQDVAEFYEREVDYDLARIGDLIEPILLVIMGAMVLLLALGVFLPIWNMINLVQASG